MYCYKDTHIKERKIHGFQQQIIYNEMTDIFKFTLIYIVIVIGHKVVTVKRLTKKRFSPYRHNKVAM